MPDHPLPADTARHSAANRRTLLDLLFSQGFGSRHECEGLIRQHEVAVGDQVVTDPQSLHEDTSLELVVQGQRWPVVRRAVVVLHKPAGFECSLKPSAWPSVLSLLPAPLRRRGVQPVGRLDQDTTGLLLLTDDGVLLHRLTSPKHAVAKTYEVRTKHALDESQCRRLLAGVELHGERARLRAESAERVDDTHLRLVITSGKYHQVKRMVAAVGNRVEGLHRSAVGRFELPVDLACGRWSWVSEDELTRATSRG